MGQGNTNYPQQQLELGLSVLTTAVVAGSDGEAREAPGPPQLREGRTSPSGRTISRAVAAQFTNPHGPVSSRRWTPKMEEGN